MSPQEFWLMAAERTPAKVPEKVGTMDKSTFDDLVGLLNA